MKPTRKTKQKFAALLDKVIITACDNKTPIAKDKQEIIIGDLIVVNNNSLYSIVNKHTGRVVFDEIYLVESAFLIAKVSQTGGLMELKRVLSLERNYSKHFLDARHHLNTCRTAGKAKDYKTLDVFQVRYKESKNAANYAKLSVRKIYDRIHIKR